MSSYSRGQVTRWIYKIDITGKMVLDVGAGKKDRWTRNWAKGEPKKYVTLDIDKDIEGIDIVADLNKDDLKIKELTSEGDYVSDAMYEDYFDIVFCIETLEHCWDPVQAVQHLFNALVKGGVCYITAPFINPHHDQWDYLRFTGEWFEKVLKEVGFRKVTVEERVAEKGREHLRQFFSSEKMRVSKIRPEYGQYSFPVGYMVRAVK